MKRTALITLTILTACSTAAFAGTIHGKVSGLRENPLSTWKLFRQDISGATQHVTIDQKGLMFIPHIVAIQQGQQLSFSTATACSTTCSGRRSAGIKRLDTIWERGRRSASIVQFDHPGEIPLLCNVHPDMAAYLIVSPTPTCRDG